MGIPEAKCLPNPRLSEAAVQLSTQRESCLICNDLADEGVSIAWHNFELGETSVPADTHACSPGNLRLCLNLAGHGSLCESDKRLCFGPLNVFVHASGDCGLRVWRKPQERHRFLTIDFSARFLRDQLAVCENALPPLVGDFVRSEGAAAGFGEMVSLAPEHEQLVSMLLRPQCSEGCCHLRCKGVALQLMAEFLVKPCCGNPSFCDKQKCLGQERARKVIAILGRDLAEPPALDEIGREIGCSPFHLSRTFSREMGMTIPQCLRTLRMRHAAELLRSGRFNVTEAAMAVGYSSLSHFSRVFCQTMGSCPGAYSSSAHEMNSPACANLCPTNQQPPASSGPRAGRGMLPEIDVLFEAIGSA